MEGKEKRKYPLNPKNMFALSTMRWTVVAGSALMTSAFMIYLTDYSGLANAAVIATVLLTVGRFLDAVDDPLQGWIMDRSPVTRIGRFKPFLLGGVFLSALSMILLFNMPRGVPEWFKIVFLFVGYIMFTIGISFQPDMAIRATMTDNPKVREKLLVTPRIIEQFVAIPFTFFLAIALFFGGVFEGDNHRGFSIAVMILILPIAVIALTGAICVKEGPHVQQSGSKISFRDIVDMFKGNRPLLISQLGGLIGGCVFTFVVAAVSYYIKWAFGPESFGMYSAVFGAVIMFGIVLGTIFAPKLLKNKTPRNGAIFCMLAQVAPLACIFIINLLFTMPPVLFFILLFAMMFFSGMGFIPGSMISMECMDYNVWKRGKGMEGMVQAFTSFVTKAQTALAGLATGAVLIAINYDAVLYESEEFAAAGGSIPTELLNGLTLVFCLIPVFLGAISALILKAYPLKKEERDRMYDELKIMRDAGEIQ